MFFDNLVSMENGEQCLLSAWSNNEVNVKLAVATNAPRIIFMNDEGNIEPNFEITRGKNSITEMKWHPLIHALAIGWSDGCLTLWQEDDRLIRDEKVSVYDYVTCFLVDKYSNLNMCPFRVSTQSRSPRSPSARMVLAWCLETSTALLVYGVHIVV